MVSGLGWEPRLGSVSGPGWEPVSAEQKVVSGQGWEPVSVLGPEQESDPVPKGVLFQGPGWEPVSVLGSEQESDPVPKRVQVPVPAEQKVERGLEFDLLPIRRKGETAQKFEMVPVLSPRRQKKCQPAPRSPPEDLANFRRLGGGCS